VAGTILEVRNLKKYFQDVKAVDDISFAVNQGEVYTLLGPNGAGKTTTLEIIEGIRRSDSGEILYFGKTMKHVDRETKQKIGVSLQTTAFIPHLKVKEILTLFASFFEKSLPIDEVISFVSLEEKKNAMTEKLSGGQKQRLAVACALVNDPDLVFLDEPTTGLDPQARRNIWDIIENLRNRGKTIFLTTHYMEEAQRLSDRVCILDHGKIIAIDTPEGHIEKLGERNYIEFSTKITEQEIKELDSWDEEPVEFDGEKVIFPTKELYTNLEKLMKWANNKQIALNDINIRRPNLEDVFLTKTGRRLRD
jgi:ABC-2 type transport system ATP-binding protein